LHPRDTLTRLFGAPLVIKRQTNQKKIVTLNTNTLGTQPSSGRDDTQSHTY